MYMKNILFVDAGIPPSLVRNLERLGYAIDHAKSAASFDAVRRMCGDLACYSCIVIDTASILPETIKQFFDGKLVVWQDSPSKGNIKRTFDLSSVHRLLEKSA